MVTKQQEEIVMQRVVTKSHQLKNWGDLGKGPGPTVMARCCKESLAKLPVQPGMGRDVRC